MPDFELIEDVEDERKLIENAIRLYGNDAEQNYGYFVSHETDADKCIFIKNGKYGIQATFDPKSRDWVMIGTPVAPKGEQASFLYDVLRFLIRKKMLRKFVAEFEPAERKQVLAMAGQRFRVHRPNCTLYWPVYDMTTWTGGSLAGGEWKKLRNLINRITKNRRIEVINSKEAKKEELKEVIRKWARMRNQNGQGINRKDSNRTDYDHYLKLVDLDFTGCKFAKTVLVDGKAASITAGWEIPNSNRQYYSCIGVYDMSIPQLGEYANWYDLKMLQQAGYREVDFGGSPKPLLMFKKKFKPSRIYSTQIFTISSLKG